MLLIVDTLCFWVTYSGVASMEKMEELLSPERQGPLL